jgi:hypothetical protein
MNDAICHGTIHIPPKDMITHLSFFKMVKEKEGGSKQGTHIIRHTIPRSKDRSGNMCWRRRCSNQQDRSCWTNKIATNACSKGKEVRVRIHGDRQMIVVEEEEEKRKIFLKSSLSGVNTPLNPLLQQMRRRCLLTI